jgi:hypothetical protein
MGVAAGAEGDTMATAEEAAGGPADVVVVGGAEDMIERELSDTKLACLGRRL